MPRFRKININFSRQEAGEFDAGVFWILILLGAAFILINAYSVYATTDLSYKIEGERRQIKKEEVQNVTFLFIIFKNIFGQTFCQIFL